MLTNEIRRDLLNRAKGSGYPGSITEVFQAADQGIDLIGQFQEQQAQQEQEQMKIARTEEQQQVGLREEHARGNTQASMLFPDVQPNQSFNTVGMKAPIDIQKIDDQGHLVESYKNVPPGIQDLPTGPAAGTVIESPAAYQKGGAREILTDAAMAVGEGPTGVGRMLKKYVVPLNVKQYLASLTGIGKQNIDASDLTKKEKKALENARKNAEKRGSKTIEYEDYQTHIDKETGKPYQNQYEDVGGGDPTAPITKFFDPSYSMKTTLGQVNYTKNDDGTYTYTDKYDFNERKNKPSKTFIESVKEKGLDPYAQVRNIATYFGPGPGEGADVNIKLQKGGVNLTESESGLRDHMMNYLHDTGRDTTYVNIVTDAIGQHESKNVKDKKQDSYKKVDGKKVRYDGPGRGIYQFEVGDYKGGNTAMNRTANFLKYNTDKSMSDFPDLYELYNNNTSQDFSKLSKNDQDGLFIGDKIFGGVERRNAFDAVTRNRETPPTQEEVFQYWLYNHKGKVNGKAIHKLTKEEIEAERKKWNSRTKSVFNTKQLGGLREIAENAAAVYNKFTNPVYKTKNITLKGNFEPMPEITFKGVPKLNLKGKAGLKGTYRVNKNIDAYLAANYGSGLQPSYKGGLNIRLKKGGYKKKYC